MTTEFPSNSKTSKNIEGTVRKPAEKKKVEQVVMSEVVRRKKPLNRRMSELFMGGDAKSVWNYVLFDVLVPAAKDTLADATSQGIERLIFGETRSTSRRTGRRFGDTPHINYNRYSSSRRAERRVDLSSRGRAAHDFDEIILATRVEAEEVVDRLFDLISKYEAATVADLYELVGISGNYTDDKWGWYELQGAGVTRVRNGYLLDLPRPEPIN